MKLLFTADIHIKLGQKDVPVEWAKNRFMNLFADLATLSAQSDLFVIGGDIFDKVPSMEELALYFELLKYIKCDTVIYAGNHEAVKKDTTFLTHLKDITSSTNSLVQVIDTYRNYCGIDFLPYNELKNFAKNRNQYTPTSRILCTHVRGEIPPHVKPEVDLSLFDAWDLVLAGDLHSYENSQGNILYPGSPVTTSFHRSLVSTGVIILDTDTLEHTWQELELPQLLRKTISVEELDSAKPTDYHHTIYEVEGNITELGSMEDNALVTKKAIKRDTDLALMLDNDMTLEQELSEYLQYILMLDETVTKNIIQEFCNHAEKINRL